MNGPLRAMTVRPDGTLREGIEAINRGGHGIAFVCGPSRRVLGTLTDGDVRRAILAGAALESRCLREAMNRDFAFVGQSEDRPNVLDLMRARDINQIPVLDGRRRLVGLHLLHELLGVTERPNWAVILAGGKGTRLRPLTEKVPKPMLVVAGRPILERLVLHLVGWGIRRIAISVNHLAHIIERHFEDGSRFGCEIRYLRERKALGTGGPLSLLRPVPEEPVVLMNGDLVTQVNVDQLFKFHQSGRYTATLGVRAYSQQVPFGVVDVDGDRVLRLSEKPTRQCLVNAGIYVLSPTAMRMIPRNKETPITDVVEACVRKGLRVGAKVVEDSWLDIGQHDDLRKAREGS